MNVTPLPKTVNASEIAPERLAGNSALTEQQKIAEASRQFEAILLRQILASTQKTIIPSKFVDNSTAADIYRDMITNQLADSVSKSGAFGLAKTFEHQLTRPTAASDLGAPASRRRVSSAEGPRNADETPALPAQHAAQDRTQPRLADFRSAVVNSQKSSEQWNEMLLRYSPAGPSSK